ncbi:MAG: DUF3365 domain-containing protein [Betaproteobacteria bacterium]|nr:DUF3365 domain-containing protein [Betaproteobacteria bacterium]
MHIMLNQSHTPPSSTHTIPSKRLQAFFQGWRPAVKTLMMACLVGHMGMAMADFKGENPMKETREAAAAMLKELGHRLQTAMADGGPVNAIGVCHTEAPAIAARISSEERITIARVGTRVRNPVLGVPNDWQIEAMKIFADALAKGQNPAELEFVQAVKAGSGSRMELRFAKPIVTQAMCLACHGSPEEIQPEVKAKLDQLYPDDRATGYKVGELRGALVVSRFIGYNIN